MEKSQEFARTISVSALQATRELTARKRLVVSSVIRARAMVLMGSATVNLDSVGSIVVLSSLDVLMNAVVVENVSRLLFNPSIANVIKDSLALRVRSRSALLA